MATELKDFIDGIKKGQYLPSSVKKGKDKKGLLNIYDFPDLKCHVHVHFNDHAREEIGRAEIKSYSGEKLGFVDNYTVAMLRHYSEEKVSPSKRPLSVIIGMVLFSFVIVSGILFFFKHGISTVSGWAIFFPAICFCFLLGFYKRSNISRVIFFITFGILGLCGGVLIILLHYISGDHNIISLSLPFIPVSIYGVNSWFVMFGKKSKAYFGLMKNNVPTEQ